MYNTLWYVGSIIAAWTVYGCVHYTGDKAWRIPTAIQALMPAIQFFGKADRVFALNTVIDD